MIYFDDSEILEQKVLANKIVTSLSGVLAKITKLAEKLTLELSEIDEALSNSKNVKDVAVNSNMLKSKTQKLILSLALKNRVELLLNRNKGRIAYFDGRLKASGIYNENQYDKKNVAKMESAESGNISEFSLGLNSASNGGEKLRYVLGELLLFVDGKLDFSLDFNKKLLKTMSLETLTKIIEAFPSAAATVPDSMLFDVRVKQNLLKAIASYVSDGVKTKSIKNINKELGGLLSFKTEITKNTTDYIAGVQNLFDVITKQKLISKHPEMKEEINAKLKCNEKSELLPQSKVTAVLAEGLAGEVEKTEEQESEEIRINKEKEQQKANDEFLFMDLMNALEEVSIENEQEAEEEQIVESEIKQAQEEQVKKQRELQEKKKEEEELEQELQQMMAKAYSKHDN